MATCEGEVTTGISGNTANMHVRCRRSDCPLFAQLSASGKFYSLSRNPGESDADLQARAQRYPKLLCMQRERTRNQP